MADILVASVPLTGHVQPMLLVVRALLERGHTVRWYAARKFAPAIEAAGAELAPMRAAHDWDDADVEAALPALRRRRGIARVKAQLREMFIRPMVDQLRDLEALVDARRPDAILADQAHLGAALLSETRGLAWAGLGISALVIPSVDTAPFGSALPPGTNRVRNRILNWVILRALFGDVNRVFRRMRVAAGLPAGTGTYFDVISPHLYLQPTIPDFEYPRSDLPPQVHFIGPLVPRSRPTPELPAWWGELDAAEQRGVPIVLVTQGTLATDPRELVEPALRGLADEPVLVVVTTAAALGESPANARIARYLPYELVLPRVAAVVTNGGYGGVQMALRHGVPLVVAGGSEEKPEIAARVAWSGTGIDLRTRRARPAAVRAAVRRVLDEPRFGDRARELAGKMARHDAPREASLLIEALVERHAARSPGRGRVAP
jgi:UDP:flavonoid glycosyltransferase YjiC (YdhE family)